MIASKQGTRTGCLQIRWRTKAAHVRLMDGGSRAKAPAPGPALATTRLPMVLVYLFGAQCALCQGLGCHDCAHTGLR